MNREYDEHTYKHTIPYTKCQVLLLHIKFKYWSYKMWKHKRCFKDASEFGEVVYLNVQVHHLHPTEECPTVWHENNRG
jgi:hypothetical protein